MNLSLTAEQLRETQQRIDAYIQSIDAHPDRRIGAYPYYRFHEAGKPIRGTVMMFHGFSAKPHQMWRLADYLFNQGFNFYQPSIAGHTLLPAAQYWPQVDLKPEIYDPLRQKVQQDPVLQTFLKNLAAHPQGFTRPTPTQQAALMARLIALDPQVLEILQAIAQEDESQYQRYFISSHMNYLEDARARLAELAAIPGPIYLIGLSVGGAVALGLAADQPQRIAGVVAYAPLLKIYGEDRRQYVNLTGPLDIREQGWDPAVQFPVGALTAADRFGSAYVLSDRSIQALQNVPTCLILTANEDAADIETNQQFFKRIGGDRKGHQYYLYPPEALVPHPMLDPTEISQGMSNRFWRSLYQETFRFLTTGTIDIQNLSNLELDPKLPVVPPLTTESQLSSKS